MKSRVASPYRSRRDFLHDGLGVLAALVAKPVLLGCASNDPDPGAGREGLGGVSDAGPVAAEPAMVSRIAAMGPLRNPDANGVRLPEGFASRVVARAGSKPVESAEYAWHVAPDGGATYEAPDGGWVYVSNCEFVPGGVGALRFDAEGNLVDAYRILEDSAVNCAGGKTPWGTWLSCEEIDGAGRVFECDPFGGWPGIERPTLGRFIHEAVAVDPVNQHLYLTEDHPEGRLYRYVPDTLTSEGFADLSAGRMELARVDDAGHVTWLPLPDPSGARGLTREQVPESTAFRGGEGIWYHAGVMVFSTKGDNRIWAYDITASRLTILYDAATSPNPILTGVDNVTISCCGDVLVAEDGGDMEIVAILPDGTPKPLLQIVGHDGSEVTGPAFDPSGTRLYFSSQRGPTGELTDGWTFEVTGPFHAWV
jgi:uncharacterized protein